MIKNALRGNVPQTPCASNETLIFDGKGTRSGVTAASDPCLFNTGSQWLMLLTTLGWRLDCPVENSYVYMIEQAGAALPAGQTLGAAASSWSIIPNGAGFGQFITPGPLGAWDQDATESPKLVTGWSDAKGASVSRIYYTGWKRTKTSQDVNGCPVYGYSNWNLGVAEFNPATGLWVKTSGPLLTAMNPWEQMHFTNADRTQTAYSVLGDQTVLYDAVHHLWHLYYQATTDVPQLCINTIHATSPDGLTWAAADRKILATHPPHPSSVLPGGPYSLDVLQIGAKFYFVGWAPSDIDLSQQGLWAVSSSTPDGSAAGDFTNWHFLLADNNGTAWHSAVDPNAMSSHQAGLFAPTLAYENGLLWLFYQGVRQDAGGLFTSIGRASVDTKILV